MPVPPGLDGPAGARPVPDPAGRPRPSGAVRALDAVAGALAAGLTVLGLVLLIAQTLSPSVADATDLGLATGPGWDRVLVTLGAGVLAEVLVQVRGRDTARAGAVRLLLDAVVVVIGVTVLWWGWWS
ncbi:hypothetical protein [Nakamurella leprariae]|uniref:Uncharacterized protein n=1 Tax=Nakamurella leprariae TaxID=2803911 RepID=A0A938YA05_9ACTN|nr:hypothetical protein [Nakamurella leprariae]MBM9465808.1 hypothetical protein [Nakamurella leprariae]